MTHIGVPQSFAEIELWETTGHTAQSFVKPQFMVMLNRGNTIVAVPKKNHKSQLTSYVCDVANKQVGLAHILTSHRVSAPATKIADVSEKTEKWWRLFSTQDVVTGAQAAHVATPFLLAVPPEWYEQLDNNADYVVSMLYDTAVKLAQARDNNSTAWRAVHHVWSYDGTMCDTMLMNLVCSHSRGNIDTWCKMVNVMMDYGVKDFSSWRVIEMLLDDVESFFTLPREWIEKMVHDDTMLTYDFYREHDIIASLSGDMVMTTQPTPPLSVDVCLTLASIDCRMETVPQRSFDVM